MSIQSEISRLTQAVSDAYAEVANKGGTVPASAVIGNLASAIASIQGGSGGGGLPDGITALDTGTYTPSSDQKSIVRIDHGLGVAPNFCIWMIEADTSQNVLVSTGLFGASFQKNTVMSSYVYNAHFAFRGYSSSSSGNVSGSSAVDADDTYFTSTKAPLMGSSAYPIKAGYTYRWVCGVLDGVL